MNRIGDWCQTYTGKQFWPLDPRPEDVNIFDIAHALSLQCRFNGHCREFYSVAQHSVLVSRAIPKQCGDDARLWGLLHDAAEAYIGDMIRPLKANMWAFKQAESRIMTAVAQHFGLDDKDPDIVKHFDSVLLATEARDLMGKPPVPWVDLPAPLDRVIIPWSPSVAEDQFIGEYEWLIESVTRNRRGEWANQPRERLVGSGAYTMWFSGGPCLDPEKMNGYADQFGGNDF